MTLFPDGGRAYLSKFFDDNYLIELGFLERREPAPKVAEVVQFKQRNGAAPEPEIFPDPNSPGVISMRASSGALAMKPGQDKRKDGAFRTCSERPMWEKANPSSRPPSRPSACARTPQNERLTLAACTSGTYRAALRTTSSGLRPTARAAALTFSFSSANPSGVFPYHRYQAFQASTRGSANRSIRDGVTANILAHARGEVNVSTLAPNNTINIDAKLTPAILSALARVPGVASISGGSAVVTGHRKGQLIGVSASSTRDFDFTLIEGTKDIEQGLADDGAR